MRELLRDDSGVSSPRLPWTELPQDLTLAMRQHLGQVTAAVIAALPLEVPKYARPLEGAFGEGLRRGVGVALGRFLDLPGTQLPALVGADRDVYIALGRGELRQGRELETLLAAYRVGARVAFRQFAGLARTAGADADQLVLLAEAVFAYIDELSAASVEGYAHEQSLQAGESGRRRRQLLDLVLSGRVDARAVAEVAGRAGWTVPVQVAVVVVPPALADGLGLALGPAALVAEQGEHTAAVLPAPGPGTDRGWLDRRLAARHAVVGPVRALADAAGSLRLARLAATVLPDSPDVRRVEDHLATLLVRGVPDAAAELARSRLAPLETVKEGSRERLAETLLSWLRHRGERQRVAAELHVHTQTVGYRLGTLRSLFGAALEDPEGRFELELALRWRAGTDTGPLSDRGG